jgi:archaellum component FlaC
MKREEDMGEELNNLEKKREILNKLVENISNLDNEDKSLLQQVSEEVDMLILNYIKNCKHKF